MPTYVSSRVVKFPLNQYTTATLVDNNASYFSPAKLTELSPVTMEGTYTLNGNGSAGSDSTAVWNEFVYVYDQTNKAQVQIMTRTMAFDRRTAQLVNCCGSNVNGHSSVEQSGVVGYVFPIGTQKQTYLVFDANLLKPMPFTYDGTDTVNSIQAYRFVENVAPIQNGHQTVPGSLVGMSQSSATLPQFYQTQVTYWIDPDTGVLLKATQDEKVFLENPAGQQALLLFNANMVMTPASVKSLVAIDNGQRNKKFVVETLIPLVAGIVGVILLVAGILLARRRRGDVGSALTAPGSGTREATEAPASASAPETTASSAERPSLIPGLEDKPREPTAETQVAEPQQAQAEPQKTESQETESQKTEPQNAEGRMISSPVTGADPATPPPGGFTEPEFRSLYEGPARDRGGNRPPSLNVVRWRPRPG